MIFWFMAGFLAVFFLKYLVLGLELWNRLLHEGRIEDPALRRFYKPLLGAV